MEKFDFERSYKRMMWLVIVWIILMICLHLCGCKQTEYVTVEKVLTDTTYVTKWQRDSVWLHDSVLVREKGDTVMVEKWHTKYVETVRIDTTYLATHDTIPQPYPVIKEVPTELNWWQRLWLWIGNLGLLAILAGVGYGAWRLYRVYHFF
jgi:hypothetical protein